MLRTSSLMLFAVALLAGCGQRTDRYSDSFSSGLAAFPEKTPERVELYDASLGIEVRLVEYGDSGNLESSRIEYLNGVTGYEYYREDGTMREVQEFYPLREGDRIRQLKRSLLFDLDGRSLVFQRSFAQDGTRRLFGRRLGDGNYESDAYHKEGKHVQLHRLDSPSGTLIESEEFDEGGVIVRSLKNLPGDITEIALYENGQLKVSTRRGTYPEDDVLREMFDSEGVLIARVKYTYYNIEVEYVDASGRVVEERTYSQYGGVTVTVFNEDGSKRIKQTWSGRSDWQDWTKVRDARLTKVEEYGESGSVVREIEFHRDGVTPKKVRIPDGRTYYGGRFRHFREDGTLEREEIKEGYSTVKETKEFSVEDDVREEIHEDYLQNRLAGRPAPEMLDEMPTAPECECCGSHHEGGCCCGCGCEESGECYCNG